MYLDDCPAAAGAIVDASKADCDLADASIGIHVSRNSPVGSAHSWIVAPGSFWMKPAKSYVFAVICPHGGQPVRTSQRPFEFESKERLLELLPRSLLKPSFTGFLGSVMMISISFWRTALA